MKKTSIYRFILLLVFIALVSSCSANPYPSNQYRMDEAMLLMLTARMNLLGEEALMAGITGGTAGVMKPILQTRQEKVDQLNLLADYYKYYAQKYGERDAVVRDALWKKSAELREQANKLERRLQRGGFFRQSGRVLGRVVCFVMERVGEKVETVVEENIRQTINSVVISPRTIVKGRINLVWNRLLGPLGGSAASIIRAELFPQLEHSREWLLAEANRLPDSGNELTDSILNGGSPRSDRLPQGSADQQELEEVSMFSVLSQPPDSVDITFWGPIPAMDVKWKNGQVGPLHDAIWYFEPKNIEKWVMSVSVDQTEKKILGNFSAIALYYYEDEDKLTVSEGYADIIGNIPSSQFTFQDDENSKFMTAPFEMTLAGSVHQPNQLVTVIYDDYGNLVPRYIQSVAYQDVDFDITIFGTLKLTIQEDGSESLEMKVTDCENSKFFSPSEGAQLTNCSMNLIWNKLPD